MHDPVSWVLYRKEARSPYTRGYLPDPDDIEERKAMLKELQGMALPEALVHSVMMYETPTIVVVRRMVARHGVDETWRRCRFFIDEE